VENIFEIKEEYKAAVVGFNNSGLPLGKRNDLHLLALLAHQVPERAKYFVRLPSLEEIKEYRDLPRESESESGSEGGGVGREPESEGVVKEKSINRNKKVTISDAETEGSDNEQQ
jgi:hypothetical protein